MIQDVIVSQKVKDKLFSFFLSVNKQFAYNNYVFCQKPNSTFLKNMLTNIIQGQPEFY